MALLHTMVVRVQNGIIPKKRNLATSTITRAFTLCPPSLTCGTLAYKKMKSNTHVAVLHQYLDAQTGTPSEGHHPGVGEIKQRSGRLCRYNRR